MAVDRYENVEFFLVQTSDDAQPRAFQERIVPARAVDYDLGSSESVLVTSKDTLDLLAFEYARDSRRWYTIAELNWPLVEDPLECPNNVNVIIPSQDQLI